MTNNPAIEWHVYLLECSDGTLYCGISKDVEKRLKAHNSKRGARYTKTRTPCKLLISSCVFTHSEALKLERYIKSLPKDRKLDHLKAATRIHFLARYNSKAREFQKENTK